MSLVTFEEFDPNKLSGSEPNARTIKKAPGAGADINYNEIKLQYNYGTEAEPVVSDLLLELPQVQATGIILKEEDANGANGPYKKKAYSMMIKLDLTAKNKEEIQLAVSKMENIHQKCCHLLAPFKGKLKLHGFDPNRPEGIFKSPVYWPLDNNSERIKGKSPSLWAKLHNKPNNKTLFTGLDKKPISWDLLKDVDITFVPVLHFEKIYIGAKPSIQCFITSAVITKVVAIGTETRQTSTIDRLLKDQPSLQESVEAQLAELRMARQEILSAQTSGKEFGSTDYGTMQSVNPSQNSSSQNEQTSLQDFLSNPPSIPVPNMSSAPKLNVLPRIN